MSTEDALKRSYRTFSRTNWLVTEGYAPSTEQIKLGCLQRIADAVERMANSYTSIINERDSYKRLYAEERASHERTVRRLSATRGALTKAKKAAKR